MDRTPFIVYRGFRYQNLFDRMADLLSSGKEGEIIGEECREEAYACANELLELAADYGFEGNLWHCFLSFCLANHENAYSTSCEIRGDMGGTLSHMAKQDFQVFMDLFACDIRELDALTGGTPVWSELASYVPVDDGSRVFNKRVRDRIVELAVTLAGAKTVEEFQKDVTQFYREFGVGKFGLNKAFRIREDGHEAQIEPIVNVEHVYLDDIVGYELQKKKLIENTEAFIQGKAANNVLLFGDAGTGKSSSIKGILNQYYDQGLRIIEAYKHQFQDLNEVIAQIKNRNYRFIIYMDDLSFEEFEIEYKYLKAVIEGGLEKKPDNVLIYATSNRRNLVRERATDKLEIADDNDLHSSDTVQEKLSLVYRFGVRIYFGKPDKKQFQEIVRTLAARYGVTMPEEELLLKANQWEISHGGLTGRAAQQFIDYIVGTEEEKKK